MSYKHEHDEQDNDNKDQIKERFISYKVHYVQQCFMHLEFFNKVRLYFGWKNTELVAGSEKFVGG